MENYYIFLNHLEKFQVLEKKTKNIFILNYNLDIRVYKGYLFVQYERIDDARRLIQQGETCLILKGNKLGN